MEGEENVGKPYLNNDVSYLWNQIDCLIDGQLLGVTWRTTGVILQQNSCGEAPLLQILQDRICVVSQVTRRINKKQALHLVSNSGLRLCEFPNVMEDSGLCGIPGVSTVQEIIHVDQRHRTRTNKETFLLVYKFRKHLGALV